MRVKNYKVGITAFLPVYNEEKRIEICLTTLKWCNEVLVLDKNSNDKTVELASSFKNVKIIHVTNTEA